MKAINNLVDAHQNFSCGRDIERPHITAFNRFVGAVGTPLLRPWFWAPDHGRGDPDFGTLSKASQSRCRGMSRDIITKH